MRGLAILEALCHGRPASIPVFDKLADDRLPKDRWKRVTPPLDLILFEGWCVGATPQPPQALAQPLNALEREKDADGAWRAYVNAALAGSYRQLFDQIDTLIMLKAPSFEIVLRWRLEQEATNAAARQADDGKAPMSEAQIAQFIQYYERITRHMLAETPRRADLVINLDEHRQVLAG
jgi:D-glycerate 3-kinase